jgi:large subunit ribosomal protein L22
VIPEGAAAKTATVFTDEASGQQYGLMLDTRNLPKLKPGLVQRRLANCKTYVGTEKSIRQSPWKLNRICQLAAGLTLEEALTQLKFCSLKNADLVAKVLKRTSNLSDIRDGIQMSQLEVAECFSTKAMMLKRLKPMGRGRCVMPIQPRNWFHAHNNSSISFLFFVWFSHGVMHHKYSHIRVVLREIDFPLRIYQQESLNQKKKWLHHQQRADQDGQAAKAKREEMERLVRQQEEQMLQRKAAESK